MPQRSAGNARRGRSASSLSRKENAFRLPQHAVGLARECFTWVRDDIRANPLLADLRLGWIGLYALRITGGSAIPLKKGLRFGDEDSVHTTNVERAVAISEPAKIRDVYRAVKWTHSLQLAFVVK